MSKKKTKSKKILKFLKKRKKEYSKRFAGSASSLNFGREVELDEIIEVVEYIMEEGNEG